MINTDQPITNPNNDKLGRMNFATEIASGLVNSFKDNNESIVIGLSGNWGSGKSTLVNFIVGEIERISNKQNQEIIVLNFNPWMFTGQKELQNIFLKELLTKFKSNQAKLHNVSEKLKDFLVYLTWLKYVHSGAGEVVKDVQDFLENVNKEKDITELKEDIDKLLIESKVKLYITIDDIDRLTPSEITDIFQLVKLNGNFANTIFLLAYDQRVVKQALIQQFGENGNKYIDKIVQVDYSIPNISRDTIARIFGDTLTNLFPEGELKALLEKEIISIKGQSFMKYFSSLRDIYRFTNSLKLRLSSVFMDLNIFDFLRIEALRLFNYDAYEYILTSKAELIAKKDNINNMIGIQPAEKETIINATQFDSLTKDILKELFDIRDWGFRKNIDERELIKDRRVANKHFFDRYFNLLLGDFDISEKLFEKFNNDSTIEEKEKIIEQMAGKDNLVKFLHWVELKSNDLEIGKIKAIFTAALNICEKNKYIRTSYLGLGSDFNFLINFCHNLLGGVSIIEERRNIFLTRLHSKNGNFTFVDYYLTDTMMLVKIRGDEGKPVYNYIWNTLYSGYEEDDNAFFDEVIQFQKDSVLYLFKKYLKDNKSLSDDELTMILPLVKIYNSKEFTVDFPKLIQSDKQLLHFIWLSIKRSYRTYSTKIYYEFSESQFLPGLEKEQVKDRLDKMDRNSLDENKRKVFNFYLKAYSDGFKEGLYYDIDDLTKII
ncbi:P-loop NTPase fold protein [Chryseobacterium sp.]|uniref:KAP family P-loop NTPase fold protein n=1 Tax=Chryseobacterium sp. TaxID=1871047 RepID=UPI002619E69B|nr:P-loop NTPase fold protein [Chryseobacterium sp.]